MAVAGTLFRNGSAFDGRRHRRGCGALVAGGRIVAVGTDDDLAERATDADDVVDLAGGLLLPGFQDAHVHPVQGGLERVRCDLSSLSTREEYLAAVKEYADDNPDRLWIGGGGWGLAAFGPGGPLAADLDAVVPDRPVFLPNRDHHGAWVNSRAMELAGIDHRTPDPVDGRLERDADGRPTGTLHEGAMSLISGQMTTTTAEEYDQALLAAQAYLHSLGVTAWQDALLGDYVAVDDPSSAYVRAADAGALTARVRGALWWERGYGVEQLEGLVERRRALRRDGFHPAAVKIMQDGIAENYTAAMSVAYLDRSGRPTGNTGLSFVAPERLNEAVTGLDAAGFQVHVHAIGDRAVREALDAFEAARRANGGNDLRHHIAHLQMVHPQDQARFAELGVSANIQALWAHLDEQMTELTLPYLEAEVASWQYPFADLARAGGRLAAGSDWPVTSPNPLLGIHVAVNRTAYREPGRAGSEPFLPEQALSIEQAFAAYTSGSAFVNHLDHTGTLEAGQLADLAVLDRDPFEEDPAEIAAARVVATYVEGRAVFTG
ncbi:MAG: Exoenzymes regulatory protein AepA precursor [uncultured Nocardioidaceae bacterium]|uniref:Exoenzymes regulatory protein AepA n=1 Tax=uncultured Nocardioidaceae bacterium TaxID=253824 RepID=A0A6J4MKQ1_9ACTN|nr:MAG: Exoenzymes regulatory protein AepA precursor [uncultured Nocardioidaceae bacterium]